MDLQALKARVGDDPHRLVDEISTLHPPGAERVAALFEAFEDSPSYGILMYVSFEYLDAPVELRSAILERFRGYLEGENERWAEEVLYALWCDFFEDRRTVEEVWNRLATPGAHPIVLQRLLPAAGPVPWRFKMPLLETLAQAPRWHGSIFECLLHSRFDVFGDLDPQEARRLLGRLELDPDLENLDRLRAAL